MFSLAGSELRQCLTLFSCGGVQVAERGHLSCRASEKRAAGWAGQTVTVDCHQGVPFRLLKNRALDNNRSTFSKIDELYHAVLLCVCVCFFFPKQFTVGVLS